MCKLKLNNFQVFIEAPDVIKMNASIEKNYNVFYILYL